MARYLVKRLMLLLVTLFGITVLTFGLTRLTPGDPAAMTIQQGVGGSSFGGFDSLVELNRRNLGLDKPLFLNTQRLDREAKSLKAIKNYLRQSEFWHKDGERHLLKVSMIAFPASLSILEQLTSGKDQAFEGYDDLASREEQIERITLILPRLAHISDDQPKPDSPTSWRAWYNKQKELLTSPSINAGVDSYLKRELETLQQYGGYAVPVLMERWKTASVPEGKLIDKALSAQTRLVFPQQEPLSEEGITKLRSQWKSWWRREQSAFRELGPWEARLAFLTETQFGLWMSQAIAFDFGNSYRTRQPVTTMLGEAMPVSFFLSLMSIIIIYSLAVPIGILSAISRYSIGDRLLTLTLFILYSLPTFWVASLLLLTTTGPPFLNLFPTRGLNSEGVELGHSVSSYLTFILDRGWHFALPLICLTYESLAFISRQVRSALIESLHQDYMRTALAKGLSWRGAVLNHALRNSLLPVITVSEKLLPELIAGAIIVETIFTLPGMGRLMIEAIVGRDYPVINAMLFISAGLTLIGILITDLLYFLVDPRIRYE